MPVCLEGCACGKHLLRNSGQFVKGQLGKNWPMSPEGRAIQIASVSVEFPGYNAVHKRNRKSKTNQCSICAAKGFTDMALLHGCGDRAEIFGQTRKRLYSVDPVDYAEMCRSCHERYDKSE